MPLKKVGKKITTPMIVKQTVYNVFISPIA